LITFLLSPFGKYIAAGVGILMLIGLAFGWYEVKISEAKHAALEQFNAQQLTQALKDKDTYIAQLKTVQAQLDAETAANAKLNDDIKLQDDQLQAFINSQNDIQNDPIFNQVLNQLKGKKAAK
jgi:hypothetical protein